MTTGYCETIALATLAHVSISEMQSDIYELTVTAIVIMNIMDRVFNTYYWMEKILEYELSTWQVIDCKF